MTGRIPGHLQATDAVVEAHVRHVAKHRLTFTFVFAVNVRTSAIDPRSVLAVSLL